jgi:serine phosphatase RsbU (regulator of sigma subunit)
MERLGGDWYDVFSLPDGRTAFTIGDVCGRGLAAAVKMGQAKQAVKVAAFLQTNDPRPLAVLDQTNKVIFLNDHAVEFTTAIYGLIDTVTRTVTYACAGHHPPILAMAGEPARVMPNHGFPLGVQVNLPDLIREHSFVYEPGTLLVLYTDGLIESNHDADEGEAQLQRNLFALDASVGRSRLSLSADEFTPKDQGHSKSGLRRVMCSWALPVQLMLRCVIRISSSKIVIRLNRDDNCSFRGRANLCRVPRSTAPRCMAIVVECLSDRA